MHSPGWPVLQSTRPAWFCQEDADGSQQHALDHPQQSGVGDGGGGGSGRHALRRDLSSVASRRACLTTSWCANGAARARSCRSTSRTSSLATYSFSIATMRPRHCRKDSFASAHHTLPSAQGCSADATWSSRQGAPCTCMSGCRQARW